MQSSSAFVKTQLETELPSFHHSIYIAMSSLSVVVQGPNIVQESI